MHKQPASFAIISDTQSADDDADRRSSRRFQTILRVARVIADTDEGLARLQNISDHGVSLHLSIPVLLGTR